MLIMLLASCSGLPLGMLGGGTNVAANTQIGRENRQAVLSTELGDTAGRDIVTKEVETGQVETLTVNNQDIPPWVMLIGLDRLAVANAHPDGQRHRAVSDGTI
jgi:hypothetical protein